MLQSTPQLRFTLCPHPAADSPPYSPSCEAPAYSRQLHPHERRLSYTPLHSLGMISPLPTGRFFQSYKHATVTLYDQPEGVASPVYGAKGIIRGGVNLKNNESVLSICLTIQGTLELITTTTAKAHKVIDETYVLWAASDTAAENTCPTYLPFTTSFPSNFTPDDGSSDQRLPPSFNLPPDPLTRVSAKCEYRLLVTIHQRMMFMTQTKYVTIPITYYPRDRPRRSMLSSAPPYLYSSIKVNPDEWVQLPTVIKPRPRSSNLGDIHCLMFLPSVEKFALSDCIPFHLQLSGSLFALNELHFPFKERSPTSLSPTVSHNSQSSSSSGRSQQASHILPPPNPAKHRIFNTDKASTVRVCILRQATIRIGEKTGTRDIILGEAVLRESEPESAPNYVRSRSSGRSSPHVDDSEHGSNQSHGDDSDPEVSSLRSRGSLAKGDRSPICIDWEGDLRVYDRGTVISFDTELISFQDYILLHAKPVRQCGHFEEMILKRPIKLVTDPWIEQHFNQITMSAHGTRNGTFN